MLMGMCTSCTSSTLKPEAALWGEWAYAGGEGGNMDYAIDLSFQEDGNLTLLGRPQFQAAYVIIAPGRIKLTWAGVRRCSITAWKRTPSRCILAMGTTPTPAP
jgi:hypothetical protein